MPIQAPATLLNHKATTTKATRHRVILSKAMEATHLKATADIRQGEATGLDLATAADTEDTDNRSRKGVASEPVAPLPWVWVVASSVVHCWLMPSTMATVATVATVVAVIMVAVMMVVAVGTFNHKSDLWMGL